jgi:hypothetical protein
MIRHRNYMALAAISMIGGLTVLAEDERDALVRDHALTVGDGQGNPTLAASDTPRFRCKRCGRDEIDCRANGCERGPCPMEFVG